MSSGVGVCGSWIISIMSYSRASEGYLCVRPGTGTQIVPLHKSVCICIYP